MTETEFEKACRGTAQPVAGEYAWGTSTIASSVYSLSNSGGGNESIATGFSASNGNANYLNTSSTIGGPARVGIFAGTAGNTGRITSGATFYGIMEMSGNLYERIVTIGNPAGRAFTGIHGNGTLSVSGNADAANWPDNVTADGSGSRGGGYEHLYHLRVSDRNLAAYSYTPRDRSYGGRGVRSVIVPALTTTAASSITAISASGGGNIASQGGSAVTGRGVCWSTSHNPTTALTTKTSDGTGTGTFTSSIAGLAELTTYYVRAYATNSAGISYGNEVSFTTISALLSIGDLYQGGKVAYILQSGDPGYSATVQHGLIAALEDQAEAAEWGCWGTSIPGADGTAIGTGLQNTIDIMNGCATAGIAARLCRGVTINGYSDWYLPSKDELNKLYLNRVAVGGFAPSGFYWSSSEDSSNLVWAQYFLIDYQGKYDKYGTLYVRAVRAF
jgi:hypothetical protein